MKEIDRTRLLIGVVGMLALGGLSGCMSWTPGWESLPPPRAAAAAAEPVEDLMARADAQFEACASREDVLAAIAAYERVVAADPGNHRARWRLGEAHILLGAAYSPNGSARAAAYRTGIQWCERAMATNTEFVRLASEGGMKAAAGAITEAEMDAAFFWVTGVSYYFKECLWGPSIILHLDWIKQTERILKHLASLDADWGPGMLQFSLAIYYLGMPERYGGDMAESARSLERAIELAPTSLLMRWGRAKYYHVKLRDREGYRRDLEWVLAQDPREAGSPYRWNLYFQRDARTMLDRIDRVF